MTRHEARKAAGQCYRCEAAGKAPYCAPCRKLRRERLAETRAERALLGKCPLCGKRPAMRAGVNCSACQAANNGYSRASHKRRREQT